MHPHRTQKNKINHQPPEICQELVRHQKQTLRHPKTPLQDLKLTKKFKYPPIDEILFDDDDPANEHSQDIPSQVPLASPDAITSSTRTDFTYSPIEDVSRTQSFRNLATQPTLSPDNNNSMPLWTIFTLFATFQHGHAKP
jgi:hypothetical protein